MRFRGCPFSGGRGAKSDRGLPTHIYQVHKRWKDGDAAMKTFTAKPARALPCEPS